MHYSAMALSVFICAGGKSSRFGGSVPKLFQDLGGKPVVNYVLDLAKELTSLENIYVVTSPDFLNWHWPCKANLVQQDPALGTGHAFQLAFESFFCKHQGNLSQQDILILMGDCPLVQKEDLEMFLKDQSCITLLAMYPEVFRRYGEILVNHSGQAVSIQEHRHTKSITWEKMPLCYTGIMKISAEKAKSWIKAMPFHEEVQEYHVTDFVKIAYQQGAEGGLVVTQSPESFTGINTKEDWQSAYQILQNRWRVRAQHQGALLHSPSTVMLSWDTRFSENVHVHPFNVFGPGVFVEEGATIFSFCRLAHTRVGANVQVGPFSHVKEESSLGKHSCVGSFVEITRSSLGDYSQAKHLTYLGDATVQEDVNIGAGVVSCNYDGFCKQKIVIEKETFIGAGAMLVAPLSVGTKSTIGAGSVITQDVPEKTLSVSRSRQVNILLSENSRHLKRISKSKKLKKSKKIE
ncbi:MULTISPECIES: NTP transferase domain-containing protein [Holospora]|uniref:Bifunctional protein GlmU n=2 Tax=Holospora TaxID=44747 RepID=A0A061JFT9_9PROT|nr:MULTISPECIES: NTP transferase domain-containing protein [Holospora]ETZ04591.1 bifunctional protein GlmU [Holospora undulata HU1]GAJ45954.1 bifunctional protein GlmU [Holospora elegans E1]